MPPRNVKTISDVIYYYYAWLVIARAAGKMDQWGFIIQRYNLLKAGKIHMADRDGEIRVQMRTTPECVYCGGQADSNDHVIPRNYDGPDRMQNVVRSCKHCNSSKKDNDLVDWWINILGRDESSLPRIPIGIYLKYSYDWHKMRDSLDNLANNVTDLKPFIPAKRK